MMGEARGLADEIYGLLLKPIEAWGITHNDLLQNKRTQRLFIELCFALGSRKYKMEQDTKFKYCDQCHGIGRVEITDVRELPIAPGKYPCGKCGGAGEIEVQSSKPKVKKDDIDS